MTCRQLVIGIAPRGDGWQVMHCFGANKPKDQWLFYLPHLPRRCNKKGDGRKFSHTHEICAQILISSWSSQSKSRNSCTYSWELLEFCRKFTASTPNINVGEDVLIALHLSSICGQIPPPPPKYTYLF